MTTLCGIMPMLEIQLIHLKDILIIITGFSVTKQSKFQMTITCAICFVNYRNETWGPSKQCVYSPRG